MRRIPTGSMVLGGLALAGAGALLVVTVLRAVSVEPDGGAWAVGEPFEADALRGVEVAAGAPEPRAPAETGRSPVDAPAVGETPGSGPGAKGAAPDPGAAPGAWEDPLALAVDNDPFSPERRAPARRYRLPAERVPVVVEEPRERPEAPDFRVVGSAAAGATGLALVQIDRDEPRLVALGESLRGYTLSAVDGESATLVGPAGSLRFTVMEPLSRREDDDDRRRRRGRDDEAERRAREAQRRLELVREQMIRVRGLDLGGGRIVIPRRGGGPTDLPPPPIESPRLPGGGAPPALPTP